MPETLLREEIKMISPEEVSLLGWFSMLHPDICASWLSQVLYGPSMVSSSANNKRLHQSSRDGWG